MRRAALRFAGRLRPTSSKSASRSMFMLLGLLKLRDLTAGVRTVALTVVLIKVSAVPRTAL